MERHVQEEGVMSVERNKAIVRRLFDEVWNAGTADAIAELYAPDYVADYRPHAPLTALRQIGVLPALPTPSAGERKTLV